MKSSRLRGFYEQSVEERSALVAESAGLDAAEMEALAGPGLTPEQANQMIENVVGLHALSLIHI